MQIHQLRYFCAVARTGSFTRAAQHEHLAQPSLSQQVRKLEDELGTRLFDRLGRTVRLTQMGEAFLPRAEAILRQVGAAKLEIQEMAGTEQGKLVIGAIPTIAPYFLPSCLASFARKFPRVQVSVVEEITNELLNRMQAGAIDLALLALPIPATHCLSHELFRERLYVVLPVNHRLASLPRVHLKQIENDPFLLLKEGHCFRENTLSACGRARLQPNVVQRLPPRRNRATQATLPQPRPPRLSGAFTAGSGAARCAATVQARGGLRRGGHVQIKSLHPARGHAPSNSFRA